MGGLAERGKSEFSVAWRRGGWFMGRSTLLTVSVSMNSAGESMRAGACLEDCARGTSDEDNELVDEVDESSSSSHSRHHQPQQLCFGAGVSRANGF